MVQSIHLSSFQRFKIHVVRRFPRRAPRSRLLLQTPSALTQPADSTPRDQLALDMSLRPILRPLVLTPPAACATSAIFGRRLRLYVLPAEPAASPAPAPPRDLAPGDTECCDPAQEDVADAVEVSASLAAVVAAAVAVAAEAFFPQPGPQPERLMLYSRSSSSLTLRERELFSSLSFWTWSWGWGWGRPRSAAANGGRVQSLKIGRAIAPLFHGVGGAGGEK